MRFNAAILLPALLLASSCHALPNSQPQKETGQEKETDQRLDALFGSHVVYHKFLDDLKKAAAEDDSNKISMMINYPITANIDGKEVTLKSSHDFLKNYNKIFSTRILEIIKNQQYANIFSKSDGVMIGNGEIWFTGICDDNNCSKEEIKIIAINNGTAN